MRDDVQRWREAYQDLRRKFESVCELPELPKLPLVSNMEPQPRILSALREHLTRTFTEPIFPGHPPTVGWLGWSVPEDAPSVLRLHGQYLAVGIEEDREKVKQAVSWLIVEKFVGFQRTRPYKPRVPDAAWVARLVGLLGASHS